MVKTITFGEKPVQFSTSFAWAFAYKAQFGQDPANILMPVIKNGIVDNGGEDITTLVLEEMGFVGIVQMAWAMAKICDQSIPEPVAWVASFGDDFEITPLISELLTEAILSMFTSKNSQTPQPKTKKAAERKKSTSI